jgi:hypothetical protein
MTGSPQRCDKHRHGQHQGKGVVGNIPYVVTVLASAKPQFTFPPFSSIFL